MGSRELSNSQSLTFAFIDTGVLLLAFWRYLPILPPQWYIHSSYLFACPPYQSSTIILGDILELTSVFHSSEHKFHMSLFEYHASPTIEQKESQESKKIDRRRDRTCNLLIRSQAPCHWASRPVKDLAQF
ncbi:uncharacterized protein N7487_012046 [Penicillium crustosum]|uniref:uncharacterized protein n=1 Tax=Penicillium crustosum TaxID=36656 RepID=UPI002393CD2F|nr:uncharacterized protein N7487_012046 [Penicillium crustosum]KAJ5394405.1 hypothetical protein N7487_012046 [Penicillium crustosum]